MAKTCKVLGVETWCTWIIYCQLESQACGLDDNFNRQTNKQTNPLLLPNLLLPQNRQPPPLPPRRLHHPVILYLPFHPRRHRHHINLLALCLRSLRSMVLQLRHQRLAVPTPAYAVLLPKVEPKQPPRRQRPVRERRLPDRVIVVDETPDQGVCRFDARGRYLSVVSSPRKRERKRETGTYYR